MASHVELATRSELDALLATKQDSASAATDAELTAHGALKTGVHGIPVMASGQGIVWDGTGWVAADVATQAELDSEASARAAHAALTTGAHGGVVAANDARLTDQRTPSDASVTDAKVANSAAIAESKLALASDAAAGTASRRTLGTGATQAAPGNHTHPQSDVTGLSAALAAKQDASTAATDSELSAVAATLAANIATLADRVTLAEGIIAGADSTGATEASSALQAALNVLGGQHFDFKKRGTYLVNSSLTGPVDWDIGAGIKFIQGTDAPVFDITGGATEGSRSLTADTLSGSSIVQVTTSDWAAGDFIVVSSDDVWPGPKGSLKGELTVIQQIDGIGQLRAVGLMDDSYTLASNAKAARHPMELTARITGAGEFINLSGGSHHSSMIRFTHCAWPVFEGKIRGAGGPGVSYSACWEPRTDVVVVDSLNDLDNSNFGYGVEDFGVTRGGAHHIVMTRGRHAYTTNSGTGTRGVPRHAVVTGRATGLTETSWDSHEEGAFITFLNVVTDGGHNGGAKHRAPDSSIVSHKCTATLGTPNRFLDTAVRGRLHGGHIQNCFTLGVGSEAVGVYVGADDVVIDGEPYMRDLDAQAILVDDGADRCRIGKFTAINPGRAGTDDTAIEFKGTSTGHRISRDVNVEDCATWLKVAAGVIDVRYRKPRLRNVTRRVNGVAVRDDIPGFGYAPRAARYMSPAPESTSGTGAAANNTLQLVPMMIAQALRIDRIGVEITTSGEAGSLIRPCVFEDAGGYPGVPFLDPGTIDGAQAAAFYELTVASDIPWDLVWVGALYTAAATTRPSTRRVAGLTGSLLALFGAATSGQATNPSTVAAGYSVTDVAFATGLPAVFPAGASVVTAATRVAMRVA